MEYTNAKDEQNLITIRIVWVIAANMAINPADYVSYYNFEAMEPPINCVIIFPINLTRRLYFDVTTIYYCYENSVTHCKLHSHLYKIEIILMKIFFITTTIGTTIVFVAITTTQTAATIATTTTTKPPSNK
ncbi:DNA topoisomerase 2-beta [Dermatophagoides farinae]|uniref:DNA topoisomerase 2-beta n=1 Tax=Dermatophagoides farinae TaxID=6954 RepID=A0A922L8S8_DERFA|nr:DNA topoisomerase 2-beta [Dermatophagoides farinae]